KNIVNWFGKADNDPFLTLTLNVKFNKPLSDAHKIMTRGSLLEKDFTLVILYAYPATVYGMQFSIIQFTENI
ncbi:hypothetical protein, partial [Lentimicrobium sp.]|uniref:hypothetical protein n=1 Tax=Lentimicrobium sp. TaxID=2034841 RepID=UPI002C0EB1EE